VSVYEVMKMRKLVSTIVILLFLFTDGGYYLYFRVLQYQSQQEIKREIKKGLKENDLSLIVRYNKNHKQKEQAACRLKRTQNNKYLPERYSLQNNSDNSGFSFAVYRFHYKSTIPDVSPPSPKPAFFKS